MRLVSLLAFGFLAGLIILIYDMKIETRRLEAKAQQLQRAIEDERDNIALMRAEWSHVARPEQIETMAREMLGLQPVKTAQIIKQEDFLEVLARRPAPAEDDGGNGWRPRDEIGALIRDAGGEAANARRASPQ
jgi:cell division protein FtsL